MQEELERKTVCLVFKGAKLTTEMLADGIKKFLDKGIKLEPKDHEKHGEMKLKDLVEKGNGAKAMDIGDENLRLFRKTASKYNVDFSVKQGKDENGQNRFYVFFQGKDSAVIEMAFKEFSKKNEAINTKKSVRKELAQKKQEATKQARKTRERSAQKRRTKELNR